VSAVLLRVFVRVVTTHPRRRPRRGSGDGHTGAVTAIQRAGSFANAGAVRRVSLHRGGLHADFSKNAECLEFFMASRAT